MGQTLVCVDYAKLVVFFVSIDLQNGPMNCFYAGAEAGTGCELRGRCPC